MSHHCQTGRSAARVCRPISAVLFSILFALASGADAQFGGNAGGSPGGSSGSGSNRGGAAGVGNTASGGAPAAIGGPNQSSGPAGTQTSRSGYLGGRETSPVPPPPGSDTTIAMFAVTQFGACPDMKGQSQPLSRMSGNNMGRIDSVAQYLNPGADPQGIPSARYLLANLQEELEKASPDTTLAGTYLGIATGMPVTTSLVSEVSESLCLPVSGRVAEAIAGIAEMQRRKLTQER